MLDTLKIFDNEAIDKLRALLATPQKIVITTHRNPDGDAVGSSLGLMRVLRAAGHQVRVITPNAYDHFLNWLPDSKRIITAATRMPEAERHSREADLIFCLDFSALKRLGDVFAKVIAAAPAPKVMIDHHLDPEDFDILRFHVAGISSTAELVYRLIVQMDWYHFMDRGTAECLYTGLMTDTGSFRFSSTTADVHRIAAGLLELGINVGFIHNKVYDNFSEARTRFLGFLLYEKLTVLRPYKTAYMTLSLAEQERFKIRAGDTDGFVNYNLSLKGVNFGVLIKESDSGTKLSFRSIGRFPCNDFAAHFGGGGHFNASGGRSELSLAETEQKFLSLLDQYKDQLNY